MSFNITQNSFSLLNKKKSVCFEDWMNSILFQTKFKFNKKLPIISCQVLNFRIGLSTYSTNMIVVIVFFLIINQTEFSLVCNQKEICHYDHISLIWFIIRRKAAYMIIFLSIWPFGSNLGSLSLSLRLIVDLFCVSSFHNKCKAGIKCSVVCLSFAVHNKCKAGIKWLLCMPLF